MGSVGEGALRVAGLEVLSLCTHIHTQKNVVVCFWLNIQLINNVEMHPFWLHYCMTKL